MIEHWLEISQGARSQRHDLGTGRVVVGGAGAQVPLEGVGADQLVFEPAPWRVIFKGTGAPPFCEGEPLAERSLSGGTRIDWAGVRIEFRGRALLQELQEPVPAKPNPAAPMTAGMDLLEEKAWLRVRAGLLVDSGQAERSAVKRWQGQVMDGQMDLSACAEELNAGVPEIGGAIVERAGRLMRDFLMASKLKGASGAARTSRRVAKGFMGMAVAQLMAIGIYSLIVFGCMVFIRKRGVSFDDLFDQILGFVGLN